MLDLDGIFKPCLDYKQHPGLGEDMIGKVCLKKDKICHFLKTKKLSNFLKDHFQPPDDELPRAVRGQTGWSGDVPLGEWAVVNNLYICFSGSKRTKSVLLFASRKRLHTKELSSQRGRDVQSTFKSLLAILRCTHRWHALYGALLSW